MAPTWCRKCRTSSRALPFCSAPPKDADGAHGSAEGGISAYGEGESGGITESGEDGATQVHIDHYAVMIQKARELAEKDPKAVANIIKDWMGVNGN